MPLRLTKFSVPPYRSMPSASVCGGVFVGIGAGAGVGVAVAVGSDAVATGAVIGVGDAGAFVGTAASVSVGGAIVAADVGATAADCVGLVAGVGAAVEAVDALSTLGEPPSAPSPSEHPPISGTNSNAKAVAARRAMR